MNEQKNQHYICTAGGTGGAGNTGTPPAEPLDIPPLVALSREEARSILTRGFASVERIATAHGMLAALLGTYYALRRVEAQLAERCSAYGRLSSAFEGAENEAAHWKKRYEKEVVRGRERDERHQADVSELRAQLDAARKPRRKGGRK